MRKHNCKISDEIRKENSDFNKTWISENQFVGCESVATKDLDVYLKQKKDASAFQVVWLKNIDRIINLLPSNFDKKNYELVDIGCGSGISSLYFASKYEFNSYFGFDFSLDLIRLAEKNKSIFLRNNLMEVQIKFEVCDALEYKVNKKSILFMFNPFGCETMRTMILNNLDYLKESESLILYANDLYVDLLEEYGYVIKRDDIYNLSCIQFK